MDNNYLRIRFKSQFGHLYSDKNGTLSTKIESQKVSINKLLKKSVILANYHRTEIFSKFSWENYWAKLSKTLKNWVFLSAVVEVAVDGALAKWPDLCFW